MLAGIQCLFLLLQTPCRLQRVVSRCAVVNNSLPVVVNRPSINSLGTVMVLQKVHQTFLKVICSACVSDVTCAAVGTGADTAAC